MMGQLTLYLDDAVEKKIKQAAKSRRMSVSKLVSRIVKENISAEWPQEIIRLAGSWKEDFPTLEEIRASIGIDAVREDF